MNELNEGVEKVLKKKWPTKRPFVFAENMQYSSISPLEIIKWNIVQIRTFSMAPVE